MDDSVVCAAGNTRVAPMWHGAGPGTGFLSDAVPHARRPPVDWLADPGRQVRDGVCRMLASDLPFGNPQVLLLLCTSITQALSTGEWDQDARQALSGEHGSLLARFNRAQILPHEPGCLLALARLSQLLRKLYPPGPAGLARLDRQGLTLAHEAAQAKLLCLMRAEISDLRLDSIEAMHQLADALLCMAFPAPQPPRMKSGLGTCVDMPCKPPSAEPDMTCHVPVQEPMLVLPAAGLSASPTVATAPKPATPQSAASQRRVVREAWFAALQGSSHIRTARLDAWLKQVPELFDLLEQGHHGLWFAISHGKTGVVDWMIRQPAFAGFLFAPAQSDVLAQLLAGFDIENEDNRIDALKVLLVFLRQRGREGQALLDRLTPSLLATLPSTRKLLVELKLHRDVVEVAPLVIQVRRKRHKGQAARKSERLQIEQAQNQHRLQLQKARSLMSRLLNDIGGDYGSAGMTALMAACAAGDQEQVQRLLETVEQVQEVDADGRNALMHAAMHGHTGLFLPLLLCRAGLDKRCKRNFSALDYARRHGRVTWRAMLDAFDSMLVMHLHELGSARAVEIAMQYKVPPDPGKGMLHTTGLGEPELRAGLSVPDEDIEVFLRLRRQLQTSDTPQAILAQRDHNGQGCTPLRRAIRLGDPLLLRVLLESGACIDEVDEAGNTGLMDCVLDNNWFSAELCLVHYANLNQTNPAGETALMLAARLGRLAIFNLLLCNGADWRCTDLLGKNASDHALECRGANRDSMFIAGMLVHVLLYSNGLRFENGKLTG